MTPRSSSGTCSPEAKPHSPPGSGPTCQRARARGLRGRAGTLRIARRGVAAQEKRKPESLDPKTIDRRVRICRRRGCGREKATAELEKLGERIARGCGGAWRKPTDEESRQRLAGPLGRMETASPARSRPTGRWAPSIKHAGSGGHLVATAAVPRSACTIQAQVALADVRTVPGGDDRLVQPVRGRVWLSPWTGRSARCWRRPGVRAAGGVGTDQGYSSPPGGR